MLDSDHIALCYSIVDPDFNINSSLKFVQHCTAIVSIANVRSKLIVNIFLFCYPHMMCRVFFTYVRPLTEYYTPAWSPYYKRDIDLLEAVQRAFIRNVIKRCHLQPAS